MSPRPPTFLFIGGDRCGSKWLHNVLLSHPNVIVPRLADPYFFDRFYDRGWDWYVGLFDSAKTDVCAVGELSHDYLFSSLAAGRIAHDLPTVKILATLRQPFDKAYSAYNMWKSTGYLNGSYDSALIDHPTLLEQALYFKWLREYYARFPREHIKIMIYDDLAQRPRWFAQQILEFVGAPFVEELDYESVFNDFSVPRAPLAGVIAKQLALASRVLRAESVLGRFKHHPTVRNIFFTRPTQKEPGQLSHATYERIRDRVDDDILQLQDLTGLDLRHWLRHENYIGLVEARPPA